MKRKGLILFDILMAIVVLFGIIFGTQISTNKIGLNESSMLAENVNKKFDFVATPDYQRKQAGQTAKIKLKIENIDMGE
ncbi:MAG: hypothetical protein IJH12_01850, partial [Clostridia bacterium]|nr:hypothetical protein [Clostridia bacterium]